MDDGKTTYICNFMGRPQLVSGTDYLRPAMSGVWIRGDYLYSSNAHVLLREHRDMHEIGADAWAMLNNKMFEPRILDLMKKEQWLLRPDGTIRINVGMANVIYTPKSENDFKAPGYERVISNAINEKREDKGEIIFNPLLLSRLSNAFARESHYKAKLVFNRANTAIVVETGEPVEKQVGIIMPMLAL